MKKFRVFILIGVFLGMAIHSFSQVDKDLVALGNDMYDSGDWDDALGMYRQAIEVNPDNPEAHLKAGKCLVKTACCKHEAVESYLVAYELDPTIDIKIYFHIADGYHKNSEFDSAAVYYEKYKEELEVNRRDFLGVDVDKEIILAERGVFECANGKEYTANPEDIQIENAGDMINSEYEDYAPIISVNDDEMYFTSRRAGSTGDLKHIDNKYFEDIWYSKKIDGDWTEPTNVGSPVNDGDHNANLGLSPDGTRLFIYSTENRGDIFYSDKEDNSWSSPKSIGDINTEYDETSISITSDGKMMFYTTSKPGGFGGTDIYYCELNEDLSCAHDPRNIGSDLNTSFDEEGPYYDVTNNILYFSSKGHKGMGGFDLYESYFDETKDAWSEPINLGIPVNSTDDDLFLTVTADGLTAYYSTYKEDSHGGNDIYTIYPIGNIKENHETVPLDTLGDLSSEKEEPSEVEFKIVVLDENGTPLEGKVEIKNNTTSIYSILTDSDGLAFYKHSFLGSQEITVYAEKEGFYFDSKEVVISKADSGGVKEITFNLRPSKQMEIRPLRNIYFGFDRHTLTPESYTEIDKLYQMMVDQPTIRIEIAGHTDFIGGNSYNKQLSNARAGAVRSALIKKGIASDRVQSIGYGEAHPLATNDDESEGRELNRRTEFIIIPH